MVDRTDELNKAYEAHNGTDSMSYFLGIDGSPSAQEGLDLLLKDIFREKKDKLTVGHIYNPEKKYLPFNLKPNYLQDTYESKLIHLGRWARYVSAPVDSTRGVKDTLWKMAVESEANMMVTGFNGIKGPKADPTIAGSAIKHLGENAALPLLVIKHPIRRIWKDNKVYHYGACYDGSPQAKYALQLAIKMMRPEDSLTTISVREKNWNDNTLQNKVMPMLAEKGHTGKYKHLNLEKSDRETVYATIKTYLKQQEMYVDDYIDWICIGNTGRTFERHQSKLGSLADAVLRAKRMNVLFCPCAGTEMEN